MKDAKWRVIQLQSHNAFMNMAIDEAVSESVAKGQYPTIRFYKWLPSAVSVGYFQSLKDEVNIQNCKELGIDIIRRRTGGGAVYHSNRGEITYSVIGPTKLFPKNIIESYQVICDWIILGLAKLGIKAEFSPINDIIVKGKKISGNAQTRRNNILLQHGTILFDVDVDKMFSVLNVPDEKIKDKLIKDVKERVTRVLDFKKVDAQKTYEALLDGFTKDKSFEYGDLTEVELLRAKELVRERYSKDDWNYMK
ncbi:lipoate--protein ligase family protein [archaeon]|jgi:lipoate---protein ligase|nr:lipoate--protein ligase family protein [archaeon]MBT4352575.1 lipoate--protein ligase family protein [archaeon]MBT4648642.1 lipoate--protein ligase family protein [archaeon]MBT6821820.1 lipoate--protein ligase family protein [archaeon]MBT7392230.1 lipoate--protein ligase family protein [archaeon]